MRDLITQLDQLLRQHRPEYYQKLQPGEQAENISELEQYLGFPLPPSFKALYQWKNGQPTTCFEVWQNNQTFMNLAGVTEAHKILTNLLNTGEFEVENWWHPGWTPFLENGAGDYFCVDMAGAFSGLKGQIIEFRHDSPRRKIVVPSLEAWLESYIRRLKAEDWDYLAETGDELFLDWDSDITGYPIEKEAGNE